jgi:hypothetical protein
MKNNEDDKMNDKYNEFLIEEALRTNSSCFREL